jgi:transcriptional regulator with XRE-family HTH domain
VNPIEEWLTQANGLASRLRALRTQAGLSGKDLAESVDWQPSKVSRLENGRQLPSPTDIDTWTRACGAAEETTRDLTRLLSEAQNMHHDWRRRMRRGQRAVQASYNKLVQDSQLIRYFETVYGRPARPGHSTCARFRRLRSLSGACQPGSTWSFSGRLAFGCSH